MRRRRGAHLGDGGRRSVPQTSAWRSGRADGGGGRGPGSLGCDSARGHYQGNRAPRGRYRIDARAAGNPRRVGGSGRGGKLGNLICARRPLRAAAEDSLGSFGPHRTCCSVRARRLLAAGRLPFGPDPNGVRRASTRANGRGASKVSTNRHQPSSPRRSPPEALPSLPRQRAAPEKDLPRSFGDRGDDAEGFRCLGGSPSVPQPYSPWWPTSRAASVRLRTLSTL